MNIPPLITLLRYKQATNRYKFVCNGYRVTETTTHFLHQIDLSQALSNTYFKSIITNRANLSIRDINGNIMPSKIMLDLINNKLFVYFDGSKTVASNTVFYLYADTPNQVDSVEAFTNCGITNFWGFDETGGTTAYDYVSSANINLTNFSFNQIGIFDKSALAITTSSWGYSSSNLNYANTTSMVMFLNLKRNSIGQEKTTIRYGNWSVVNLGLQFNSNNTAFLYSGGARFTSNSVLGVDSAYHTYTCIYNGNLVNEQRLKLYYDGQLQTLSTSGTVPTSFTTIQYPVCIGHNADWSQIGNYDNMFFMNSCTEGFIADRHRVLFEPSTFYTIVGFV